MNADQIKAQFPGYAGWNDRAAIEADFRATGGQGKGPSTSSPSSSSSSSSGNFKSVDPGETIRAAMEEFKKQIQPSMSAYESRIPEIQSSYTQAREQLQGSQPSLEQKYNDLVAKIKGQQTESVNRQTNITASELGKRGLTGSSTLAQQEIANAIEPIEYKYKGLTSEAERAGADAVRELQNQITNLTPQEQSDIFAIKQAMGQLQQGAGQAGMTAGLNLYGTNLSAQQAAQEREDQQRQQALENALKQAAFKEQTRQFNVQESRLGKTSDGGGIDLSGLNDFLAKYLNNGTTTNIAPSSWQPSSQPVTGKFGPGF